MITIDDPRINELLALWHENGRALFARVYSASYAAGFYDGPNHVKTAKDRSKYIALDNGTSGCFLLDKATECIYQIKAYGVPNKKKYVGTLDMLISHYRALETPATVSA